MLYKGLTVAAACLAVAAANEARLGDVHLADGATQASAAWLVNGDGDVAVPATPAQVTDTFADGLALATPDHVSVSAARPLVQMLAVLAGAETEAVGRTRGAAAQPLAGLDAHASSTSVFASLVTGAAGADAHGIVGHSWVEPSGRASGNAARVGRARSARNLGEVVRETYGDEAVVLSLASSASMASVADVHPSTYRHGRDTMSHPSASAMARARSAVAAAFDADTAALLPLSFVRDLALVDDLTQLARGALADRLADNVPDLLTLSLSSMADVRVAAAGNAQLVADAQALLTDAIETLGAALGAPGHVRALLVAVDDGTAAVDDAALERVHAVLGHAKLAARNTQELRAGLPNVFLASHLDAHERSVTCETLRAVEPRATCRTSTMRTRAALSADGDNDDVDVPSEYDIQQYQIFIWSFIIILVVIYVVVYYTCTMPIERDPMVFGKTKMD